MASRNYWHRARRSIELAATAGVASIAFPCISTGIYGYPVKHAARIAVGTVASALCDSPGIQEVIFCCFSGDDLAVYERVLNESVV